MTTTASINGIAVWQKVQECFLVNKTFESVTGIEYQARCTGDVIIYCCKSRNNGEEESISKQQFISSFEAIKHFDEINTNTIKGKIQSSIYRKRTPLIGILKSCRII
jgi:hypothetical protein